MEIIDRATAGLRPPSSPLKAMPWPDGIILHWVGSGGLSAAPARNETLQVWRNIQAESMAGIRDTKYIDTPYSFGVDPMGLILEGRGFANQSAANGSSNYNAHAFAICYLGGPGLLLTNAAKDAITWLAQQMAAQHAAVSYVKPHSDIFQTQCPGDELRALAPIVQAKLHLQPPPAFKVRPRMFPPMQFTDIVDTLAIPSGGAWLLSLDGRVFAVGRGSAGVTIGGPAGHSYWSGGRQGAQLKPHANGGYTVVDTAGETYNFLPH